MFYLHHTGTGLLYFYLDSTGKDCAYTACSMYTVSAIPGSAGLLYICCTICAGNLILRHHGAGIHGLPVSRKCLLRAVQVTGKWQGGCKCLVLEIPTDENAPKSGKYRDMAKETQRRSISWQILYKGKKEHMVPWRSSAVK